MWWQVEGQDVNNHEEGAGDDQVHHIQYRPSLYHHLQDGNSKTWTDIYLA